MTEEKTSTISRRKFVASMGMLAAALPLGSCAFNFTPSAGNGFNFMLLGDIHYDKVDHHDLDYVRSKFGEGDVTQIQNYSRIAAENLPKLLVQTKQQGQALNADFYLQLGDFVEGLCGSEQLATKQTEEFISLMKAQQLNRPFFVIKGNHDITGIGAPETYKKVVLPWQTSEQKQEMKNANSTFVHKNARFILFDGYTPDQSLEWLKGVLADNNQKLIFFCVHQPVIPFNARSNWHVFGRPDQQKQREELLNLLGDNNAVVLCGHLHKTSILTRKTARGKIVQVCTGSVMEFSNGKNINHLTGVSAYGPQLTELEPKFNTKTLDERKLNLENEKPFISYFEYADFMGYSTVAVSEKGNVEMAIYKGWDATPWKKFSVTDLFKV